MLKYILFSFMPGAENMPVHVAVPYETPSQLAVLYKILTHPHLNQEEARYLDEIYNAPPLGTDVDLSQFTYFIRQYK